MYLELTDEQRLLRESAEKFLDENYSFEKRATWLESATGCNDEVWSQLAELGWLGASLPEEVGGFGGNAVANLIICEQLGRSMVIEPYVSTAVLASQILLASEAPEVVQSNLAAIIEGSARISVAFAEAAGRYDVHHVATRAVSLGAHHRLSGQKIAVHDAPSAHRLIVSARLEGDSRDQRGIGLFMVDAAATGLSRTDFEMMDGSHASQVELRDVDAQLLVPETSGLSVLERAIDWAICARCAQAVGAMDQAQSQTLEYVKAREQFGTPIGKFQVIQHRMVDILMDVRECQSMMRLATSTLAGGDAKTRTKTVSAAKQFIGERATRVGKSIVQLHGGLGMSEELPIGHFFRYLHVFATAFGSTDHHLKRFAALSQSN